MKDRNHSINSTDSEKTHLLKFCTFIIITLQQLNIEGMNLDVKKDIDDNYIQHHVQ